jgi:hypothetical protein
VMLGQGYRTPHGAVVDEYGAMVELSLSIGKPKNYEKNLPSAALFTTSPTRNDLGAKSGLRGERPATTAITVLVN